MTAYLDSLDPAEIHDHYVDTITQEKNMTRTQPATTYYATTAPALNEVPEADSLSDITTRDIELDGGHVTVEHFYGADGGRVEMTVHLGGVLRSSLILTADEGEALGIALARPHGPTVGDYFDMHDRINCGRVQA